MLANGARHLAARVLLRSPNSLDRNLALEKSFPGGIHEPIFLNTFPSPRYHANRSSTSYHTITATMRVSALAFAAVLSLVSAKKINMHCKFAEDNTGMVQQPYCCRDMAPARGNPKANEALDCMYSNLVIFDH